MLNITTKKNPKVIMRYKDLSGFYKHENLENLVNIAYKSIKDPSVNFTKSYESYINNSFPCTPNNECLEKFTNSKLAINQDVQEEISEIEKTKEKTNRYKSYL
jgi:hypothetical protein